MSRRVLLGPTALSRCRDAFSDLALVGLGTGNAVKDVNYDLR